jgi:hypothetical protein
MLPAVKLPPWFLTPPAGKPRSTSIFDGRS